MIEELAVSKVLAKYVRGVDARNGKAVSSLFITDSITELFENHNGERVKIGELQGSAEVEHAFGTIMSSHPKGGWSHHTTMDHIIDVNGDHATINAQFIVYQVQANKKTVDSSVSSGGTITPKESGYYHVDLKKIENNWKISHHRVILDFLESPSI